MSLIKKKITSLEEVVQSVSHLYEGLQATIVKLGLGEYPEITTFNTYESFLSKLLRVKRKQF